MERTFSWSLYTVTGSLDSPWVPHSLFLNTYSSSQPQTPHTAQHSDKALEPGSCSSSQPEQENKWEGITSQAEHSARAMEAFCLPSFQDTSEDRRVDTPFPSPPVSPPSGGPANPGDKLRLLSCSFVLPLPQTIQVFLTHPLFKWLTGKAGMMQCW